MSADAIVNIVIGVAAVAFLIARQLRPRPATQRADLRITLVLAIVGIIQIRSAVNGHSIGVETIVLVTAGLVVGAALGLVRAMTVTVWRSADGVAWRRGTLVTAALWIVSLGVHLGIGVAVDHSTTAHALSAATILLYVAVTLGVQREIVRARATRMAAPVS